MIFIDPDSKDGTTLSPRGRTCAIESEKDHKVEHLTYRPCFTH